MLPPPVLALVLNAVNEVEPLINHALSNVQSDYDVVLGCLQVLRAWSAGNPQSGCPRARNSPRARYLSILSISTEPLQQENEASFVDTELSISISINSLPALMALSTRPLGAVNTHALDSIVQLRPQKTR